MDRDKAISFMHDLLRNLLTKGGSDLFVTVGAPPSMKIDGKMVASNQSTTYSESCTSLGAFYHE